MVAAIMECRVQSSRGLERIEGVRRFGGRGRLVAAGSIPVAAERCALEAPLDRNLAALDFLVNFTVFLASKSSQEQRSYLLLTLNRLF